MKTSNLLKTITFLIILISTVSACKKDNPVPADYNPVGKWVGTYVYGNNTTGYMALDFKANHAISAYYAENVLYDDSGYWTTNGNTITAFVDGVIFKGEVNTSTGKITGTWGTSPSDSDGGTWTLTKQ